MKPLVSGCSTPIAPISSSLACEVEAVNPEVGVVLRVRPLLFVLVRSSVPDEIRPENSDALAAFATDTAGSVIVIVPPAAIAATPCDEKMAARRPEPRMLAESASLVYVLPLLSETEMLPEFSASATVTMTLSPAATPPAGTVIVRFPIVTCAAVPMSWTFEIAAAERAASIARNATRSTVAGRAGPTGRRRTSEAAQTAAVAVRGPPRGARHAPDLRIVSRIA